MREIIEVAYHISGILLVIGIGIGIAQLRVMKRDYKIKNQRIALENSLKYLDVAKRIIVDMADYSKNFEQEVSKRKECSHLFNREFIFSNEKLEEVDNDKELIAEIIISSKLGIDHIFNELEVFSAAMINNIADEKVVFTPFGKIFCDFIEQEHMYLSYSRSLGAPFENLLKLFDRWSSRLEVQSLEVKQKGIQEELKEKKEKAMPGRALGLD